MQAGLDLETIELLQANRRRVTVMEGQGPVAESLRIALRGDPGVRVVQGDISQQGPVMKGLGRFDEIYFLMPMPEVPENLIPRLEPYLKRGTKLVFLQDDLTYEGAQLWIRRMRETGLELRMENYGPPPILTPFSRFQKAILFAVFEVPENP